MHLNGFFETIASRPVVWNFLLDPNEIGQCFPDLQSLEVVDADNFKTKVIVGLSVVRGTMDFDFRIIEKKPQTFAKLVGNGRGLGSSVELETTFTLDDADKGTRVTWVANVNVSGIIAGLGSKLLDSTSNRMVTQVLENIQTKLKSKEG